jgi:ARG and Rhodanese-Phosphatase-superfamily-associated Protein domain
VFPLLSEFRSGLDYLMLAEGLRRGLVTVREISEGGSVPDLVVENRADVAVLIVDGEELVGAKQNRVANLSMLIPARQTTTIPVSCVEQGRWADASADFAVTERVQYARGRAETLASVQRSMRATGSRRSDQAQVWSSVREKAAVMDAASPTEAMGAIFERHATALDGYVEAFVPRDGQVGAIFVVGDAIFGLDVFDQPASFAALLPKLVRSYAIDALNSSSLPIARAANLSMFTLCISESQPSAAASATAADTGAEAMSAL